MSATGFSLMLLAACLGQGLAAAEVVIVQAEHNKIESLAKDDLAAIYQGKKANWDDGDKITIVTVPSAAVHESFLKDLVGKTPSQFSDQWKKLVFTGKAKAPVECKTEAEVIAFVAANPNAVGYVSDGIALPNNVRIVPIK